MSKNCTFLLSRRFVCSKSFTFLSEMSAKQKGIKDFFKPQTGKRPLSSLNSAGNDGAQLVSDEQATKSLKLDELPKKTENTVQHGLGSFLKSEWDEMSAEELKAKIHEHAKKLPALHPSIHASWFKVLSKEFTKPYFKKLSNFVSAEREKNTVYPPEHQVWAWTRLPIEEVKVVILGQDPYHGRGQAHGLCFSVCSGIPAPPSLGNMYIELKNDIQGFQKPNHGNLTGWCEQGVLLLNATLTVRASQAKSHAGQGWENLTDAVIKEVNTRCNGVVFLLWGAHAQSKAAFIDKKKHHTLMSVHPSPLSAHRGFIGCKHFSKCNDLLQKQGKKPIDWNHLPEK